MHLTPEILERAYEYLRATPPFNKWKLPDADDVIFSVSAEKKLYGHYQYDADARHPEKLNHHITVSEYKNPRSHVMMETLAHEMIHLHQRVSGLKTGYHSASHGRLFKRWAAQVCKAHGFDLKTF